MIESPIEWNHIKLASVLDIACTKIITISMRGSKKDFVDMYFLLQKYSLQNLFDTIAKKYTGIDYNVPHLLKSLVYFDDAESQPMPRLHQDVSWENIKQSISQTVTSLRYPSPNSPHQPIDN